MYNTSGSAVPNDGYVVGAQVAFRLKKGRGAEVEWIQCEITKVIGEGSKIRYVNSCHSHLQDRLIINICTDSKFKILNQMKITIPGNHIKQDPKTL